jgi:6-phosphogluconate dehydrogenase (decarboxylating)
LTQIGNFGYNNSIVTQTGAVMKVIYKGIEYFLIGAFGETVEIAPTRHGAGSFEVHKSLVTGVL